MAKIVGIEGMTPQQLSQEIQRGGKFLQFQYCVSVIVMTFKRGTDIYFVRSGESPVAKGLGWTALTLVAGWWGIPFGPIFSVQSLWYNLKGGHDVTDGVVQALRLNVQSAAAAASTSAAPPPIA